VFLIPLRHLDRRFEELCKAGTFDVLLHAKSYAVLMKFAKNDFVQLAARLIRQNALKGIL
jgi:hypothetical protein